MILQLLTLTCPPDEDPVYAEGISLHWALPPEAIAGF